MDIALCGSPIAAWLDMKELMVVDVNMDVVQFENLAKQMHLLIDDPAEWKLFLLVGMLLLV